LVGQIENNWICSPDGVRKRVTNFQPYRKRHERLCLFLFQRIDFLEQKGLKIELTKSFTLFPQLHYSKIFSNKSLLLLSFKKNVEVFNKRIIEFRQEHIISVVLLLNVLFYKSKAICIAING